MKNVPFRLLKCTLFLPVLLAVAFAQERQFKRPVDGQFLALDDFLSRSADFGFSGSVIVAKGDQILFRKSYGLIDRQRNLPVTPDTAFSIASLDKQFIAAAILKLEEAGKIKVSDSITRFFDFVPEDKKSITIHQLLSHTSGIPDNYWDEHKELSRSEYVRYLLNNTKLQFPPGAGWTYTSGGYIILEEVIARAAREPYEEFIQSTLFEPLGMKNTGYPNRKWNRDRVATYRLWTMDIDKLFVDATDPLNRPRPLWVILSTVDDMYRWYLALKGRAFLSAEAKTKLFTPVLSGYGYGWNIVKTQRGTRLIHHGGSGSGIGMNASFRWFADEDVFVGVLSNSTNFTLTSDFFMSDVEAILFGGSPNLPPPKVSPATNPNDMIVGKYELKDGSSFEILPAIGNRLAIRSFDSGSVIMLRFPNSFAPVERVPQNLLANEIVLRAVQADFEPLSKLVSSPADLERRKAGLQRFARRFAAMGKPLSVSTVHQKWFVFEDQPELQSFVLLHFEKGKAIVRFTHQASGKFEFSQMATDGIESLLVPTGRNELSTWDFTLNTSARITYEKGSGQIRIRSPYGETVAKRTGGQKSSQN